MYTQGASRRCVHSGAGWRGVHSRGKVGQGVHSGGTVGGGTLRGKV